jgi:hypothetical protein
MVNELYHKIDYKTAEIAIFKYSVSLKNCFRYRPLLGSLRPRPLLPTDGQRRVPGQGPDRQKHSG